MAELEILQALVSFFCPTSEAASTCREFIQNHSQVLPPIGPLFYFLLFPAVFTILFVLLLMDNVGVAKNRSWGIKVLLGITAFIFIIISGWYPIMLILSEFWYIIIILLGFLWFVTGHRSKKEGGGGGGPSGKMPGLGGGGLMEALGERGMKELTGERKRLETQVDLALTEMEKIVKILHDKPESWRSYSSEIENCRNLITQYYNIVSVGNIPLGGGAEKKIKRLEEILSKIDKDKS